MLGPISHLQIWDGNWGAHAELWRGGKLIADLVALPRIELGEPEIIESVYSPEELKDLPDDFRLVVRALDKDGPDPLASVGRYGGKPESHRRWQTSSRYGTRKAGEVKAEIPSKIDRIRTMRWGAGEAVWLDYLKNGFQTSLVFGPHWGGVEVLEVATQRPADLHDWVHKRLDKMGATVYCAMETRR